MPIAMDTLRQFGRRIAELRQAKGKTRKQLAEETGLSVRFLADVEAGCGNIALSRLLDLCRALGTPLPLLAAGALEGAPERRRTAPRSPDTLRLSVLALLARCDKRQLEELRLWLSRKLDSRRHCVALIGLRGAGKTTVGKRVAARLGWRFVELDARIVRKAGLSLQDIFEVHGENYYRELEAEVLKEVLTDLKPSVLATGGGIVTQPAAFDLLRRHCMTVWLHARPEDHWTRVLRQDPRPMANHPDAFAHLQDLLRQREPLYTMAELRLDTSTLGISECADRVASWLESQETRGSAHERPAGAPDSVEERADRQRGASG